MQVTRNGALIKMLPLYTAATIKQVTGLEPFASANHDPTLSFPLKRALRIQMSDT
jgi:hypothetical protein